MLSALLEHPTVLAVTIIAIALLNYGLAILALRIESNQRTFLRAALNQPMAALPQAVHQALPFTAAVPIAAVTLFLDASPREALSGGFLVMQVVSLFLNMDSLLRLQVATINGIASGEIILSAEYQHRTIAARIMVLAVFCEVIAASFGNLAFATGGAFLFATAVGYYRRAALASRQV